MLLARTVAPAHMHRRGWLPDSDSVCHRQRREFAHMPVSDTSDPLPSRVEEAWQRSIAAGFCPLAALAQHVRKREGEKRHDKPMGSSALVYGAPNGGTFSAGLIGVLLLVFLFWLFGWYLWISPIIDAVVCKKYVWAVIVFFTQFFGGLIYRLSGQTCHPQQVGHAASQATDAISQSMTTPVAL